MTIVVRSDASISQVPPARQLRRAAAPTTQPRFDKVYGFARQSGDTDALFHYAIVGVPGQSQQRWDLTEREAIKNHDSRCIRTIQKHCQITGRRGNRQFIVDTRCRGGNDLFHLVDEAFALLEVRAGWKLRETLRAPNATREPGCQPLQARTGRAKVIEDLAGKIRHARPFLPEATGPALPGARCRTLPERWEAAPRTARPHP